MKTPAIIITPAIMKTRTIVLLVTLLLLAGSCIPCLFPLYTKDDIVYDDRIVGSWDGGDNGIWVIEKLEHHPFSGFMDPQWTEPDEDSDPDNIFYKLTVYDTEDPDTLKAEFIMHLLELDGQLYADYYPEDYDLHHDFLSWHMIETHNFSKIRISENRLDVRFFDPWFLTEMIENNRIRIDHVKLGENILVTAGTRDLQKFVIKYADDEKAIQSPDLFNRMPDIGQSAEARLPEIEAEMAILNGFIHHVH
jgi:hypothetical protein